LTALLLIALLTSVSAWLFFTVLEQHNSDAEKINISGMQRMLSQKIALYVNRLNTPGDERRERAILARIIDEFESNHAQLTQSGTGLSPDLQKLYFQGNPSLNTLVNRYIIASRALLDARTANPDNLLFNAEFTEPLLFRLNSVVEQFEREANQRVQILKSLEMAVWLTSLLLLVLEARFIFYPMERSISQNIEELNRKIEDIQSLDSEKQKLEIIANQDPLTGLYSLHASRDYLQQLIDKANRNGYRLAVLFVDLDNFKPINDRYGHDAGDRVLAETARRIRKELRKEDIACRVGGDEFLLTIDQLTNESQLEFLCRRLLSAISIPMEYEDTRIQIYASIGCAIFPEHALDANGLKKLADEAMYEAKRQGKNSYYIFGREVENL